MKNLVIGMIATAGLATAASADQVNLKQIGSIEMTAAMFSADSAAGQTASAIAWNGTDLFVAGYQNGASNTGTTGIIKISDALGAASVGAAFGVNATPGSRGYSGLDISGGMLAAAFDDGAVDAQGITAWDMSGNQLWAKSARGGSGVGFDPGFNGADAGVAWTTFGSGRRALQDAATGADIYTTADGMIITPDFQGSFWRDMDFASNGDMVARRSNDVVLLNRTGGNSGSASLLVENNENGAFVNGQNVSYVESGTYGDFVIYNDRASTSLGQSSGDVLKAVRADGSVITLNFFGGPAFDLGNGYYDFSYDAATDTLAILDFINRQVYIFSVPAPGAAAVLGLGGLVATRRRR
jgi:hypothetical protein